MAKKNEKINENPVVKKFEINTGEFLYFQDNDILNISQEEKLTLLKSYFPIISKTKEIKMWRAIYVDSKITKQFFPAKVQFNI